MSDIGPVKSAAPPASTPAAGVFSFHAPASRVPSGTLQQQLDEMLAQADTSLRFRVDRDARAIVVSVLDHRGDVILQVPSETALSIARRLAVTGSLLDARA